MNIYTLSHLSDGVLGRDLAGLAAQDRNTTAALLAHLAEFDARRLYLPAAFPSMYAYCLGELHMSEDAACRRIRAARAARQFPAVLAALADGQLHLSAVVMLAPYLTEATAGELLAAAAHKNRVEIERLLAERFPRPDLPLRVQALAPPPALDSEQLASGSVEQSALARIEPPRPRARVAPLAPQRFALQFTIGQNTHDKLRYAQELLSHQMPSGDVAKVFDLALDDLIRRLEKTKFAATSRPRPNPRRSTAGTRHIPAEVKRTVWERDGAQCTFLSDAGQRCPARTLLEFDHADPVARGGQATAERMRLRCRAHNQYAAECAFGKAFMSDKREQARRAAETRARATAAKEDPERDITPWLRELGYRADEARRAAALCDAIPDASLEERIRHALSYLRPRAACHRPAARILAPTM